MGQQIQSALELIQQGKTLDDYHHACQIFTEETGFADYTLVILNLKNKQAPPATLFTNRHFRVATLFTTHAYDAYKAALRLSQQQTTPFMKIDSPQDQRFFQALEFYPVYQARKHKNHFHFSIYYPFHVRYQYNGFLMLSDNTARSQELDDKFFHGKLFADYLADKIATLQNRQKTQAAIKLTRKESLCLYILADGGSYDDIGKALGIAAESVTYHINKLVSKFGARNRYHAISLAISNNQTPPQM